MSERRRHSRVPFFTTCVLWVGAKRYETRLIDISLKGALIDMPPGWDGKAGAATLELRLDRSDVTIRMSVVPAHRRRGRVGLKCVRIDVDSVTHLRRLMELNLGDPALVERELTALGED